MTQTSVSGAKDGTVIAQAAGDQDLRDARDLFSAYANWLQTAVGVSLEFQGIEAELQGLPGKYASPGGGLYLARNTAGRALGCVGFRAFETDTCEIKRLYVTPAARGCNLGRTLAIHAMRQARAAGYCQAVLDTIAGMDAAIGLYRDLGFREISPYYDNPYPGAVYMARDLEGRERKP